MRKFKNDLETVYENKHPLLCFEKSSRTNKFFMQFDSFSQYPYTTLYFK